MKALIWSSKRRSTRVRRLEPTNCLRIFKKLSNSWVSVKSLFLGTFFTNCIRLCDTEENWKPAFLASAFHPNPVTWRQLCMWRKLTWTLTSPPPPQPSDVTSVVHVTQVNMNVNIPTPPQPSDVTSVVHVTQVNMNVNIPTPPQPSDVTSVLHASISRATCLQSAKMTKTQGSLMAP